MSHTIEKDWMCNCQIEGSRYPELRCVALAIHDSCHRTGYVGVPKGHPLYGKGYHEAQYVIYDFENGESVHGGLTYGSEKENSNYPVESDLWWFGFDCIHSCDAPDPSINGGDANNDYFRFFNGHGTIRDLKFVVHHCELLALALCRVTSIDAEFANARYKKDFGGDDD